VTIDDKEKANVLNHLFTSVLKSQPNYPWGTLSPDLAVLDGEKNNSLTIQEETVRKLLLHLDCYKSIGSDGIHQRELKELVVNVKLLSIIYQHSWSTREVPEDWRLASVTHIYKKGSKEDLGNYRPVSLTSVPGKVMEQTILRAKTWHIKDRQMIRCSQHAFVKGKSCLTNLISYNKKTRLVDMSESL